jgi:16S rRNA (cytosine1402-N4)-methyltransferase
MVAEVLKAFQKFSSQGGDKDLVIVDTTLGSGGHTAAIMSTKIVANNKNRHSFELLDLDERAIDLLKDRVELTGLKVRFHKQNFRIQPSGFNYEPKKNYLVLADLGLSQNQLDTGLGFSFKTEAPLDMRLDQQLAVTAADLLKLLPVRQLTKIFGEYGQLSQAEDLAKLIVHRRNTGFYITTTTQLNEVLKSLKLGTPKHMAKAYQALRIAVNSELDNLSQLLEWSQVFLANGKGMLAVITFHSIEQSIVVRYCKSKNLKLEIIKPSAAEVNSNPRSRSAILNLVTKN